MLDVSTELAACQSENDVQYTVYSYWPKVPFPNPYPVPDLRYLWYEKATEKEWAGEIRDQVWAEFQEKSGSVAYEN